MITIMKLSRSSSYILVSLSSPSGPELCTVKGVTSICLKELAKNTAIDYCVLSLTSLLDIGYEEGT